MYWPSSSDPYYVYNIEENVARQEYYGVNFTPDTKCDGTYTTNFMASYIAREGIPSPVQIEQTLLLGDNINLTVDVTSETNFTGSNLALRCALVQIVYDSIGPGYTYTHFEYSFLDFAPGPDGFPFNIDPSETLTFQTTFPWPTFPGSESGNIAIIALVQDDVTKEILQSNRIDVVGPFEPVPGAPTDFVVEHNNADLQASLSWINPILDANGDPLTELLGVEIYRNGALIADLTDVVMGDPYNYEDTTVPVPGMYNYELVPYNSFGIGFYADNSAWIGTDTPGAPTDVEAIPDPAQGLECTLQWTAPVQSGHGGYWVAGDWTGQKIYRNGVEVANLTGTNNSYTDSAVPANGWYSYSVMYYNASGDGPEGTALPDPVFVGPPQFAEITYEWMDIRLIGTNTGITQDDQTVGPFNLGFNFPFYDMMMYNQVWICSNGFLSFGPAAAPWTGTPLPDPATPNNLVCPFWDDLSPNQGGAVFYYYDAANERFIVQYNNIPHYSTGGSYTFQAIFYPNGEIDYMYNTLTPGTANSATVGVENAAGTEGIQVTFDGSGPLEPAPNMGIRIFSVFVLPPPQSVTVSLAPIGTPITIPANGGTFSFDITIDNLELSTVNCDIWTMVTLPNGSEYGPIINVNKTFNPQQSVVRNRSQSVPASAPVGAYTYDAYTGFYPGIVWGEDHFDFTKSAVEDGGATVDDWYEWGESFNDPDNSAGIIPDMFKLYAAYPNPFNPSTTLRMDLPENANVKLLIFDITGREVARLADSYMSAGVHNLTFDASTLSSGVYFACMMTESYNKTQKLLLVK